MDKRVLQSLSAATLAITNASTVKQLEKAAVDAVMQLTDALHGQLYSFAKDKIKRSYNSDKEINTINIISASDCKYTKKEYAIEILSLQDQAIKDKKINTFPKNIKSIIKIPLHHHNRLIGFIMIYGKADPSTITETQKELLQLISMQAALALTKLQLQEESNRALDIRDRFISLASHELRTPLTSLHGYIQLLHARNIDKDTVEARWIKELHVESLRMTRLVKELLDVNRIKQGQFAFVFNEVMLQDVIKKVLEQYTITHDDRTIIFENETSAGQAKVVGDFDKLFEMVSGLIGNAIKFSKPQEQIVLKLRSTPETVSLSVKDNGRGISKKDIAAVFDEFYKSDHASHLEGMGVGLLLARYIVENHRGKIKIASKEHKGTTVEVILPIIKSVAL